MVTEEDPYVENKLISDLFLFLEPRLKELGSWLDRQDLAASAMAQIAVHFFICDGYKDEEIIHFITRLTKKLRANQWECIHRAKKVLEND
jgi:hypothetical protein